MTHRTKRPGHRHRQRGRRPLREHQHRRLKRKARSPPRARQSRRKQQQHQIQTTKTRPEVRIRREETLRQERRRSQYGRHARFLHPEDEGRWTRCWCWWWQEEVGEESKSCYCCCKVDWKGWLFLDESSLQGDDSTHAINARAFFYRKFRFVAHVFSVLFPTILVFPVFSREG